MRRRGGAPGAAALLNGAPRSDHIATRTPPLARRALGVQSAWCVALCLFQQLGPSGACAARQSQLWRLECARRHREPRSAPLDASRRLFSRARTASLAARAPRHAVGRGVVERRAARAGQGRRARAKGAAVRRLWRAVVESVGPQGCLGRRGARAAKAAGDDYQPDGDDDIPRRPPRTHPDALGRSARRSASPTRWSPCSTGRPTSSRCSRPTSCCRQARWPTASARCRRTSRSTRRTGSSSPSTRCPRARRASARASTGRRRSGTCPRLARRRAASRPTRSARTCRG